MQSYRPAELFDANGTLRPEIKALAPRRTPPHERQPRKQRLLRKELRAADFRKCR
jgi:xylulose-5-phosphate/fructose-6-phosphate phosphoketolase